MCKLIIFSVLYFISIAAAINAPILQFLKPLSFLYPGGGFNINNEYLTIQSLGTLTVEHKSGGLLQFSANSDGKLLIEKTILKGRLDSTSKNSNIICDGVFGIYKLSNSYYLALITNSSEVLGTTMNSIRKVEKIELVEFPFSWSDQNVNRKEKRLLLEAFKSHSFYFSVGEYDLTRTFQNNNEVQAASRTLYPWQKADERFFWNLNSVAPLIDAGCDSFVIPVVNAWIASKRISYQGVPFEFTLLSRRSRRRQGSR